jgi:hypothetical protein
VTTSIPITTGGAQMKIAFTMSLTTAMAIAAMRRGHE